MRKNKKRAFTLIIFLLCLPFAEVAQSFTFTYKGHTLTYRVLNEAAKTCEVVRNEHISGDVAIPAEASGYVVISIGSEAFQFCSNLTSITIPSSVTTIGYRAFYECRSLTSVIISSSVNNIGGEAFSCCNSLKSITIPSSVTYIGEHAFEGCYGLISILVENGNSAYSSVEGVLYDKEQFQLIQVPAGKKGIFSIPSSVTKIGDYAFEFCRGLTSVIIPSSVEKIGSGAFLGCDSLTSITIPSSVTEIGYRTFECCSSLTSVIIPSSVTEIGDYAFCQCHRLTSITIPSSVTKIGYYAFFYCIDLREMIILSSSFENLKYIGYGMSLQYIYAHKFVIDKWGGDLHSWDNNAQVIELAPIETIAEVLETTGTELAFRLKPMADDGSEVQTLYYEGKPLTADEAGIYRLTGLYPDADIALSADVLRNDEQERAGFYLYAHSVIQTVELRITEAGFATLMLPYGASLPEGVEAYATSQAAKATADGWRVLTLEESDMLHANTPYIIKGYPGTYRFSGIPTNAWDTYTAGWLTGTFERVSAVPGTYVLQNNDGVTGFYRVTAGKENDSLCKKKRTDED